KWLVRSGSFVVDGAGQQILADAAFAENEDGRGAACCRSRLTHHAPHSGRISLDIFDTQAGLCAVLLLGDLAHVFDGIEKGKVTRRLQAGFKDGPQGDDTADIPAIDLERDLDIV